MDDAVLDVERDVVRKIAPGRANIAPLTGHTRVGKRRSVAIALPDR
jgi:hypothetical protein